MEFLDIILGANKKELLQKCWLCEENDISQQWIDELPSSEAPMANLDRWLLIMLKKSIDRVLVVCIIY